MKEPVKAPTLAERIEMRAQEVHPDKASPVISKIIEARGAIVQERLRGHSWAHLVDILAAEGVNLSQGTLRNYMAKIGRAEAALKDKGVLSPTNEHIRAAVWREHPKVPAGSDPPPRPQQAKVEDKARAQRAVSVGPAATLSRNPDREL